MQKEEKPAKPLKPALWFNTLREEMPYEHETIPYEQLHPLLQTKLTL